ncbi:ROK family transcriptional regulator [Dictyobacter formicarum]|uniref:Sugar kinase n=1 Tax=Dictyobacter formicarum TaxID=2778368 RepID=A0ABQ3VSJ8_9CHLR|nr:ROK family transcriptional regulator [Dictyobacter formicarum]GHO88785.1 sugar kinase [Dictyobacter formicarum]
MSTTESNLHNEYQTGTPSLLRSINERTLLEYLRSHKPTSRAQLARATGLSKPTVSQALASLERASLVRAVGQSISGKGGRTAILYEPHPDAGYVVGIDLGRGWVRAAVANLTGQILVRMNKSNDAQNASALVTLLSQLARDLVAQAGLSWSQVVHAVIGTPGVFDEQSKRVLFASNLPGWGRHGLVTELQAAFGLSLSVENDANLAALGERSFGWGSSAGTFVYITLGTGIGMGIIINGALYRGGHGAAGEIGFLPFGLDEIAEETEKISDVYLGMFEEATAAKAIVRQAQKFGLPASFSPKQIFDAAQQGNSKALALIEQEGYRLALAVSTITAILDPELIVLGGGIGQRDTLLLPVLERRLQQLTPLKPRVVASKLGDDGILLGSIATALEIAHKLVFQHYVNSNYGASK